MSDLISRQAALDGKIPMQLANGVEIYSDEAVPVEYLKRLPSAEPVRHGKWKQTYLDHEAFGERPSIFYCSACCACSNVKTNYCSNCGARMDKE